MKKTLLTIATVSAISLTGVSTLNLTQPATYAQVKKTFSQEIQGKWTNQNGDEFTIKNSNARLKVAQGKHHGVYKFKVTKTTKDGYNLKAQGKKIAKTNKFTLSNSKNGVIKFKYGKQKIKFNNQELIISEKSTTSSNINSSANTASNTSTTTPATPAAAPVSQSQPAAQQTQTTDTSKQTSQNNQTQTYDPNTYGVYSNPEMYSTRGF